ncbi:MAG: helix-turn-helix transcriptional regulator [Erysipelotrichaceae bacterium]
MNIQTANKLLNYRKKNNLSQEALAEKLGVSRQAVSKWERAEASPDTDNIILLAKIYGISLDELLNDEEITEEDLKTKVDEEANTTEDKGKKEYVHIGLGGIHVLDRDGTEVHVSMKGIHVTEGKHGKGDKVDIDSNGVYVNDEPCDETECCKHQATIAFPLFSIACIIYLLLAFSGYGFHPIWIILLIAPVISSTVAAIKKRNITKFNYPVLVTIIFLYMGLYKEIWHPSWIIFLTIPIFYTLAYYIKSLFKKEEETQETKID